MVLAPDTIRWEVNRPKLKKPIVTYGGTHRLPGTLVENDWAVSYFLSSSKQIFFHQVPTVTANKSHSIGIEQHDSELLGKANS